MMRYWVCVITPKNWEGVRKNLVWGVDDRYEITMKRLAEKKDVFAMYVTKEQIFKGLYKVEGHFYYDNRTNIWGVDNDGKANYPYRIRIRPVIENPIAIKSVFNELLFITNRRIGSGGWSDHFQFSMISICEEDYNTLEKRMEKS